MKKFKTADAWISIVLIVSFTVLSLIKLDYTFLVGYCVVGGWQMISMVIHAIKGWFTHNHKSGRHYYHLAVAYLSATALLGLAIYPVLLFVMVVLVFAAPLMAVYYTWLCYNEVFVKMQRPMAALK
jgi:hypothetical protein